jgi:hypothetical protein
MFVETVMSCEDGFGAVAAAEDVICASVLGWRGSASGSVGCCVAVLLLLKRECTELD